MAMSRVLDAATPFPVWAPGRDPASTCDHGVWIETPFDTAPREGEVSLRISPADRLEGNRLEVHGPAVEATLDLAAVRCAPRDERAARLLASLPWFEQALADHLPLLRQRAQRAIAQLDRRVCDVVLSRRNHDRMVPYDLLFPHDWDLIVQHDGRTYWVVDQHCSKPTCPCTTVVAQVFRVDGGESNQIGTLRFDSRAPGARSDTSARLVVEVYDDLRRRHGDILIRRHAEIRAAVRRLARNSVAAPAVISPSATRSRNGPCPCGSGKKYKRCCVDKPLSDAG